MEPISLKDYTVKGIKTFLGMEGNGYNANLYRGKKKVAFLCDSATGGETDVTWEDRSSKKQVKLNGINFSGDKFSYKGTPEEKIFIELLAKEPKEESPFGGFVHMTPDVFFGDLVDKTLNDRKFKRLCKTKTVFILKVNKKKVVYTITRKYDDKSEKLLKDEYEDRLIEVINKRYIS